MRTSEFDFELPPELIAQVPAPRRDESRLLVLHRASSRIEHRQFRELPGYLRPGDLLVLNNSRVIPARLRGINPRTGGRFEILLLEENAPNDWWVLLRPAKRARPGTEIMLEARATAPAAASEIRLAAAPGQPASGITATVIATNDEGRRRLRFRGAPDIAQVLGAFGEVPLPPYIRRPPAPEPCDDAERYQTIFAGPAGSVAAPTAGLHFTGELLAAIRSRGAQVCFVTLHVGLGTFAPVKSETLAGHAMHEERYELSAETARLVNDAKSSGRRVIAVGTTTVRVLESAARLNGEPRTSNTEHRTSNIECRAEAVVMPGTGRTRIFIHPPYDFKVADALLTNFHLPRSTLLMLVSAFAAPGATRGREAVLAAYAEAIRQRYRFFSYGDAMLLV